MNNLLKRTIFGILFCAVVIASTVIFPQAFPLVVLVVMYYMMSEFFAMSMFRSYFWQRKLIIFAAWILFVVMYMYVQNLCDVRWLLMAAIPVLAVMISILFYKDRSELDKLPYLFTGLMYIGVPTALLPVLVFHNGEYDGWSLLSFIIIIWASDVGAYCFGTMFGQKPNSKKLAPHISPKKSWWGFWSGLVFAILAAYVLFLIGKLEIPLVHSLAIGAIISVGGVCGDLFESVWKRHFGVKDSGNIIPGHGGMLDRFDSSLIAIPMATVYLAIFNLL